MLMYKIYKGIAPGYLTEVIKRKSHTRNLRSRAAYENQDMEPTFCKTALGFKSLFSSSGLRTWLALPADVKRQPTLEKFKKHLKTHLFGQSYDM